MTSAPDSLPEASIAPKPETAPRASWRGALAVYLQPRVLIVLLLGFSSGLPLALSGSTLLVWMRESGVDLGTIGLFALVGTPYTLKFLWAPLVDALHVPLFTRSFGRRRGCPRGTAEASTHDPSGEPSPDQELAPADLRSIRKSVHVSTPDATRPIEDAPWAACVPAMPSRRPPPARNPRRGDGEPPAGGRWPLTPTSPPGGEE